MAEIRIIVHHAFRNALKGQIQCEFTAERVLDDGQGGPIRFREEKIQDNRPGTGRSWNSDIRIVRSILLALCFPGGSPA
jgi:hypothetical protein